jgi:hypothetical protein
VIPYTPFPGGLTVGKVAKLQWAPAEGWQVSFPST